MEHGAKRLALRIVKSTRTVQCPAVSTTPRPAFRILPLVTEQNAHIWTGGARQVHGDPRVAVAAAGGGLLGGCRLLVRD